MMRTDLEHDERRTVSLAIGRILRMMSRPTEPGDVAEYERCKKIVLDTLHPGSDPLPVEYQTNWVRDRLKGAAGD